jgi:hypothetical protein
MKDADRKRHAELVSRDDDLSSEGNVSRRCANADAETLFTCLCEERPLGEVASGCRTLRAQHGESLSAVRERQTRRQGREVCVGTGGHAFDVVTRPAHVLRAPLPGK